MEPVKIIFFVPSDLPIPEGTHQRLTKIAEAAEAFLFDGMTRQGYPPAAQALFKREADGQVEWLPVHGDDPAASGKYDKPDCRDYIIQKAVEQYHVRKEGSIWWIFLYLKDRTNQFGDWNGHGDPHDGGFAMVNYDNTPGEIQPDQSLTEGFNARFELKSVIHELGHALGLPHVGPDPTLASGNSLMGPRPIDYAERHYPDGNRTYLTAASAAMLWKHPLFRGGPIGSLAFRASLADGRAAFDPEADTVTFSGKIVTDQPLHSVVLIDDRGDPSEYWSRSYVSRLAPDGTFRITVTHPATLAGHYRLLLCFESGAVSGIKNPGDSHIAYRYHAGRFQFGAEPPTP